MGPTIDREEIRRLRQERTITDGYHNRSPRRDRGQHLTITIPDHDELSEYSPTMRVELTRDGRVGSARQAAGAGGAITRLAPSEEVPSPEQSPLEEAIQCANAVVSLWYENF